MASSISDKPYSFYKKAVQVIDSMSMVLNAVAIVVLAAMMFLTVADVSMRYFFNSPITGATEITEFMMALIAFLGLAYCAVKQGHLKLDFVISRFPQRIQAIIDTVCFFVGLLLCGIIAWRAFVEGIEQRRINMHSSLLEIPHFPFFWVMSAGFAVLTLVMVMEFIKYIRKAVKG